MQYLIRDDNPFVFFAMIPHYVDDMHLSPQAYRLYGHLKRVAGEAGKCWQSTETLAEACNMAVGSVSKAKKELIHSVPPLINVSLEVNPNGGKPYHLIALCNIWPLNKATYSSSIYEQVHNMKLSSSPDEPTSSQYEVKKNPIKKTSIKNKEVAAYVAPHQFIPLYDIPAPFNTPDFLELWSEFSKNRNDKKKPLTEVSIQRLFKKFSRYSYEVVIQAMETAVTGGYQGVFPESVRVNGHAPKPAQPEPARPTEEELDRMRADVAAKVAERNAKRKAGFKDPEEIVF